MDTPTVFNILEFETAKDAYLSWLKNKNIWKLSFKHNDNFYLFTIKLKREVYNFMSESRMINISNSYALASDNDIFWIQQSIIPDHETLFSIKYFSRDDYENAYLAASIVDVLSELEFVKKYIL